MCKLKGLHSEGLLSQCFSKEMSYQAFFGCFVFQSPYGYSNFGLSAPTAYQNAEDALGPKMESSIPAVIRFEIRLLAAINFFLFLPYCIVSFLCLFKDLGKTFKKREFSQYRGFRTDDLSYSGVKRAIHQQQY